MKPNDKFEEILRQKLEQIQPKFQEEDWGRFRAYQQLHIPASFWGQFGSTLMYSAAGLVATVLVVTNFYQYRQNQQLDSQLAQLQTQLAQQAAPPERIVTRTDTVFVNRYIAVEATSPSQNPDAYNENLSPQNTDLVRSDLTSQPKEVSPASPSTETLDEIVASATGEKIIPISEDTKAIQASDNEQETVYQKTVKPKTAPSSIAKRPTSKTATTVRLSVQKQAAATNAAQTHGFQKAAGSSLYNKPGTPHTAPSQQVANTNETPSNESSEAANESLYEPLTPILDWVELATIAPAEIKVKRYAHLAQVSANAKATQPKTTSPPPSISFKGVKFRLGVGASVGDRYTGYSLNSSVLLGKYWSIDIGLKKSQLSGPQFFTEELFKQEVKKDFDDWRKTQKTIRPPMAAQIFNIQTNVDVIRVPVTLTYRWPLRDDFTILASAGSNFNLSAQQFYSYQIRKFNGEFEKEGGDFRIKPALNNDVMLGFGVEKRWSHLVAQVETYTAPYLSKPSYLTENRNIGVRFKLLYQFGKN